MKKLILLIVLAAFFAGCEKIPYEPRDTNPEPVMKIDTNKVIDMNIKWC